MVLYQSCVKLLCLDLADIDRAYSLTKITYRPPLEVLPETEFGERRANMTGKQNAPYPRTGQHSAPLKVRVKPSELTSLSTVLNSYANFLHHIPALPAGGHLVICYLDTLRLRCTSQWQHLSPLQRTDDEAFALEVLAHEMIALGTAIDFYRHLMRVKTAYQTRHASKVWQHCTDVFERFVGESQKRSEP